MSGGVIPQTNTARAPGPSRPPAPADSDRDGIPDNEEQAGYELDFNNDGVPDSQSLVSGRVDADADGVADYPYGTDEYLVWEENGNVLANVFIGKVERPVVNGEDAARIYIDTDADPATGYSVGGMGAERMLEFRGKGGIITSANYSIFSGASPGTWAWSLINTPSYMWP
jgi:hypothetical protein